jgi:predicted metal-dependent phosphotriesterase family hydrolase
VNSKFYTANGQIDAIDSGYILPHEHVVLYPTSVDPKDHEKVYEHFVPIFKELVEKYNCKTIVELSARLVANIENTHRSPGTEIRKDFKLLQRISGDSGMNIVICTGFYREHTRPNYFNEWSAEKLADQMVEDLTLGIDGTEVKAGIIKVAIDDLCSDGDRKLLKAAAIAQKKAGVSISGHTCTAQLRYGFLNFLEGAGVDPAKIYVGHCDANSDASEEISLAKRGCNLLHTIWGITNPALIGWTEGVLLKNHSAYIVKALIDEGYIDQVLASVDYGIYAIVGGFLETYKYEVPDRITTFAFTYIIPALKRLGISQEEIDRIFIKNPRRMLLY